MKLIITLLLFITLAGFAYADDPCENLVPKSLHHALDKKFPSYRIAKSTDQKTNDLEWDKYNYKGGQCMTVASADFDGDKKKDFALFLVKDNTAIPKLVVALSRGKNWSIEELPIWNDHIARCYVETTKPAHMTIQCHTILSPQTLMNEKK